MRIRRKLSVCLLVVFLCGCAGNAEPAEPQESAEPAESTEPVQETAVSEPVGFDWDKLSELVEARQFSPALDLCDEYISQCSDSSDPDCKKIKEIIKSIELISDDPISNMHAYSTDPSDYTGYSVEYMIRNKELNAEYYYNSRDAEMNEVRSEVSTYFNAMEFKANGDGIIRNAYKASILVDREDGDPLQSETIEFYDTGVWKKYEDLSRGADFPDFGEVDGEGITEIKKFTTEYDQLGRIINGYKETNIDTKGLPQYTYECLSQNPFIIEPGYTGQAGSVPTHRLRIRYAADGSVDTLTDYMFDYNDEGPKDIPLIRDENGRKTVDPELVDSSEYYEKCYDFRYVFFTPLPKAVLDEKGRVIQSRDPFENGSSSRTIDLKYADSETWESVLRNYKTIYSSYLDALNHDGDFSLLVNTSDDQKKAFEERYKLNEGYTYKLQKLEFDRNSYTAEFDEEGRHYSFTVRAVLESEHKKTGETGIAEPVIDVKLDNIEGEYLLVSQQSSVNQDSSMQNCVPVTE